MSECECCKKKKHREEKEYKLLINRLNRIEGQVRGVRSMLENDAYCTDILIQVSAIQAALNAFNRELLSNHIHRLLHQNHPLSILRYRCRPNQNQKLLLKSG